MTVAIGGQFDVRTALWYTRRPRWHRGVWMRAGYEDFDRVVGGCIGHLLATGAYIGMMHGIPLFRPEKHVEDD